MKSAFKLIGDNVRGHWKQFLVFGILFALLFQLFMLLALVFRFQGFPNYTTFYNWPGNVVTIIRSTPSWMDIWPIISQEWLVEIGRMNYDYGIGISEWSLNVVPYRLLVLTVMGALVALCLRLSKIDSCQVTGHDGTSNGAVQHSGAIAALGGGTLLVAMTNATMSWVVCCATPSWVVGLAMLGLGVSTSLALESMGLGLSLGGFSLLLLATLLLAWKKTKNNKTSMEAAHA